MKEMHDLKDTQDLILVAGHAAFKEEVVEVPDQPELDELWILNPKFQLGEPPFYVEHIRRGVVLAAANPLAMLMFSGGVTREDTHWSEASTYLEILKHGRCWIPDAANGNGLRENILARTATEQYARDSYENLLFGVCKFYQTTGRYPRQVTVVSWAFKATRFSLHRDAIRFPRARFTFDGFNDPIDQDAAWVGEKGTLRDFIEAPHGTNEALNKKRRDRNFGSREHGYGAGELGNFIGKLETLVAAKTEKLRAKLRENLAFPAVDW